MKKRTGWITAILMAALLALTACGGADGSAETEPEEETAGEVAAEAETEEPAETEEEEEEEEEEEPEEIAPELTDSWYSVFQLFGVDGWQVEYIGEVTNVDENHYWTWVPVEARLLDQDGNELQVVSESISVLEPGTTQAVIGVASCETEPASVEITLGELRPASVDAPEDYIPVEGFEASEIQIEEGSGGTGYVTGKIKNLTDQAAGLIKMTIVFKKDGAVQHVVGSYLHDLEAGDTLELHELTSQVVDFDEYEVYLIGSTN